MAPSRYLALLISLACAGCAPIPHVVTTAPGITGSLTRDGAPVANHEVRVAWGPAGDPCSTTIVAVQTNSDGSFELPRQTQLRFIYAPLVAPISVREFNVCAATPERTVLLYQGMVLLYGAKPLKLAYAEETPAAEPASRSALPTSLRMKRPTSARRTGERRWHSARRRATLVPSDCRPMP